jgi:tetratricopeptide (TPR) repeat protein
MKRSIIKFAASLCLTFAFANIIFAQDSDEQKDPVAIFNQAQDLHEKGDLADALKLYDEALKITADFPEAEFQKGAALQSLNRFQEAEKSYRRALQLRDDWSLPMTALGALLVRNGKFAEAEPLLAKAATLEENNFTAVTALAELRLKTKATPDALKQILIQLQNLSGKTRAPAALFVVRAAVERTLGDFATAKQSISRAISLDAKNTGALLERGEVALAEGDAASAFTEANRVLKSLPGDAAARHLLVRAEAATAGAESALKTLDSFDEKTRKLPEFIDLRQSITQAAGGKTDDIGALEKRLGEDQKNVTVLSRLCIAYRRVDPPKALEACRRAYELEPKNLNHVAGFGAALVQAKQFPAAITLLSQVIAVAPENYSARANLAVSLFESKRYAEAIAQYEWLLSIRPDLAIAYYFLGVCHDKLQNFAAAKANYEKFLSLADKNESKIEIENVNFRLPLLLKQLEKGGKKGRN